MRSNKLLLLMLATVGLPLGAAVANDVDLERGANLHRTCALCHGLWSQGIFNGAYPRLAGMPEYYLRKRVEDFRKGQNYNPNIQAMSIIGGLHNMPEQDVKNLVAYISAIDLSQKAPQNIPTAEGNVENGSKIYDSDCKDCHGRKGEGKAKKKSPPLAGQYTPYLARQIQIFNAKKRYHDNDPKDETFKDYTESDLRDILAYISTLDD